MSEQQSITPEWLGAAAIKIEGAVRSADASLLEAARLLVEVKAHIEGGAFSGVTWREWSSQTLSIGDRRVRELLRVGKAPDPATELAEQRAKNTARQQRHRAAQAERGSPTPRLQSTVLVVKSPDEANASDESKRTGKGDISDEAKQLIDWAMKASRDRIEQVLEFIANLPAN
ncbi:hypothetical protein U91I_00454 [alpha proteobacterium U9-1i]|nr:hypothetical protein U91I_00454 [alpha proteobacterium U9-1i]